ncbi:ribonuclease P protein component [Kribbella jejuensis]|uniref:Ribonuclease P protein component n=1 Tax=Kribbella jejuensis TaxID=236068 RepID=A0A542EUD1_9ACTN|nr:ribonuclease P protein component [Kribbella jejuensis]
MNRKLGATGGVSGGRRSVVVVGDRSVLRPGPDSDDGAGNQLPTTLSTRLWKTLGIPGLTCPQGATYRGSVGVEPAVSCCAPCETTLWVLQCLRGAAPGTDPISGFVDKFVISSNRSHSSEQADVPAEQPSPAQEARLPSSYAYPCGSRDHRRPPWQGSSAPRGLSDLSDGDHLVLPASNRLRRSDDFRRAVRSGRRAARRAVVLHVLAEAGQPGPPRVGFVVNKAVGNAVLRNRVHRRLRAVLATRLPDLPAGSLTVVRALPSSATSSYDELVADVDGALRRLVGRPG